MAVSADAEPIKIGVVAETEEKAAVEYGERIASWRALLKDQGTPEGRGRDDRDERES